LNFLCQKFRILNNQTNIYRCWNLNLNKFIVYIKMPIFKKIKLIIRSV
jgi:hypothetical protein